MEFKTVIEMTETQMAEMACEQLTAHVKMPFAGEWRVIEVRWGVFKFRFVPQSEIDALAAKLEAENKAPEPEAA